MFLQYVEQQALIPTFGAPRLSWSGNLVILVSLLTVMTVLAFARFAKGRG
jgi:hypothetical protein